MFYILKKYLKLYWAFFKASLAADLEYRANFFSKILTDIIWYAAQISIFEVLYQQSKYLGTWDIHHTRIFLGILFITDAFYMILFTENVDRFSEKVRRGDIDLTLAKPVNSQFIMSLQRANTACIGNLILGLCWLVWSIQKMPEPLSYARLAWLFILIPNGLLIVYVSKFLFSCVAVLFTNAENVQYLWYQIYRLGMRPDVIYRPWLKFLIFTIIPVGLIASVPARFVLEPPNFILLFWALFVGLTSLKLSNIFWHYCLRRHTSASS